MSNMVENAVILAAGRGSRLLDYSKDFPKPMTTINNRSIINNLIHNLDNFNVKTIVVITGYMYNVLEDHIIEYKNRNNLNCEIVFIRNLIYDKTNNIYSLWLAKDYLKKGFYLFEADIFCDQKVLERLTDSQDENIAVVGKFLDSMNGTIVEHKDNYEIEKMVLKKDQIDNFDYSKAYKTVNFYKIGESFSKNYFLESLEKEITTENTSSYYELIIKRAIEEGITINSLVLNQEKWWEIDTPEDLSYAKDLFS
ncbi:MAG: hypothetical protein CSA15_05080 [Candidatus Delongbacteria bacterium]|nr:MAG: hypothetical protein CSA15_05080 [Candidatus Delongbacteria bacterium]